MSYADDLKHPLWQERRLRVLDRAGFQCVRCGSKDRQLHAHHKTYIRGRKPWEYDDTLLECLCDDCHRTAHEDKDRLELLVAKHASAMLPTLTVLMDKLGAAMKATNRQQRVDALNSLQDELDAAEDYERGDCMADGTGNAGVLTALFQKIEREQA